MHWPAAFARVFTVGFSLEAWLNLLGFHPLTLDLAWHYSHRGMSIDWFLKCFYFIKKYPKGSDAAYNLRSEGKEHDVDHFEAQIRRGIHHLSETFPQVSSCPSFCAKKSEYLFSLSSTGMPEKKNPCLMGSLASGLLSWTASFSMFAQLTPNACLVSIIRPCVFLQFI